MYVFKGSLTKSNYNQNRTLYLNFLSSFFLTSGNDELSESRPSKKKIKEAICFQSQSTISESLP